VTRFIVRIGLPLILVAVVLATLMGIVGQALPYEGEIRYFLQVNNSLTPYTMDAMRGLAFRFRAPINTSQMNWSTDDQYLIAWIEGETYLMEVDRGAPRLLINVYAYPRWSPDGRSLIFESYVNDFLRIFTANADGTNVTQFMPDASGEFSQPSFSSDSTQIAYAHAGDLYVSDLTNDSTTRLTYTPEQLEIQPNWSPDGQQIAFLWHSSENFITHLSIVDINGENRRDVSTSSSEVISPIWSPDSEQLAFFGRPDYIRVFIADANTGLARALSLDYPSNMLGSVAWTFDGQALHVDWFAPNTVGRLAHYIDVVDVVTGEQLQHETLGDSFHLPSPDGDWIAVYADDTLCINTRATGETQRCFLITDGTPLNFRWLP
jgi:dipeptidyl aminopeptidase/acylaminoacyl peptidase